MQENHIDLKLFLVLLGGNSKSNNIELHDIRWVIGKVIEDTFPQLRKEWFGSEEGLHIDSFMQIKYIDGFAIKIIRKNTISPTHDLKLWFVNLGGYNANQLAEIHKFNLIAAQSAREAKEKAKLRWDEHIINKHKDNLSLLAKVDNCNQIEVKGNSEILLIQDPKKRSQALKPDWFGYKRIDRFK
tara:strand:- start:774 stop:1328 length:555 start_codon:yes stop_codon:yes gene_type:complete